MKQNLHTSLLGLFVLGSAVLVLAGLFYFGSSSLGRESERVVMFFNESVHGLDPGAPVKIRGVRVGQVSSIQIRYDPQGASSFVEVRCRLDRHVLQASAGEFGTSLNRAVLSNMVDHGLFAKLGLVGITGLLYVELDFDARHAGSVLEDDPVSGLAIIPSQPSAIAQFTDGLGDLVTQLRDGDLGALIQDIRTVLVTANQNLEAMELPQTMALLRQTVEELAGFTRGEQINGLLLGLESTVRKLNQILDMLSESTPKVTSDLQNLLTEAGNSAAGFQSILERLEFLLGPQRGLDDDLSRALDNLSRAGASLERLADFLEKNPNALLLGR